MSKFWIKTIFWQRLIQTLALLGTPGGILAGHLITDKPLLLIGAACAALSAVLAIWFVDSDKNGIVDLFEKK